MILEKFGWNFTLQNAFDYLEKDNLKAVRVISEDRDSYLLITENGEIRGKVSGAFRYKCENRSDFPAVGDWVAINVNANDEFAIINKLLPRTSLISRKAAGKNISEHVLAANVDYVFIISGLDNNYNLSRIERYVTQIWNSGAKPVIVLNKVDLITNDAKLNLIINELNAIAMGVPIHCISTLYDQKITELAKYFVDNKTVVLLGSSGVGKSTLTNKLLGVDLQKTTVTRLKDSKGRHTTTRRQLFLLPFGGMLIDTPGMRELQLWLDKEDVDTSFIDIDELAKHCRFSDCTHTCEIGCAVQEAITNDLLDNDRLKNYSKMQREVKYLAQRQQENSWSSRLEKRKFGKLVRDARDRMRSRYD
jgi:ribosome biogenesis GTPase / thiamine phosphate phosphatase